MNNSCVPSVASGRAERVAIRVKGGGGCVSKSKSEVRLLSPDGFVFVLNRTGGVVPLCDYFFSLYSDAESNRIRVNGGLSLWVRAAVGLACRPA